MNAIKVKQTKLSIEAAELDLDKEKCTLDKIEEIRLCLGATVNIHGVERPVFDESETERLKSKLFELLHKL